MPELKPCPFCGNTSIKVTSAMGETWAYCKGCGASLDMLSSKEEAIKAWNNRHELKPAIEPCKNCGFISGAEFINDRTYK